LHLYLSRRTKSSLLLEKIRRTVPFARESAAVVEVVEVVDVVDPVREETAHLVPRAIWLIVSARAVDVVVEDADAELLAEHSVADAPRTLLVTRLPPRTPSMRSLPSREIAQDAEDLSVEHLAVDAVDVDVSSTDRAVPTVPEFAARTRRTDTERATGEMSRTRLLERPSRWLRAKSPRSPLLPGRRLLKKFSTSRKWNSTPR
jgi:hypothetical protein